MCDKWEFLLGFPHSEGALGLWLPSSCHHPKPRYLKRFPNKYIFCGVVTTSRRVELIRTNLKHIIEKLENQKDRASQCQYVGPAFNFLNAGPKLYMNFDIYYLCSISLTLAILLRFLLLSFSWNTVRKLIIISLSTVPPLNVS